MYVQLKELVNINISRIHEEVIPDNLILVHCAFKNVENKLFFYERNIFWL